MPFVTKETPKYVYAMQHKKTKRIYVGATFNIQDRIYCHYADLKGKRHKNELMQADVDKYGCDFEVFILDKYERIADRSIEVEWMDKLNTGDKRVGYNYKDAHFRNRRKDIVISDGVPTPNEV